MAKEKITIDYAAERVQDLLNELRWTDIDAMVRDLERLKSQLANNDTDWQSTWDETIGGCDPWGIGGMERAISIFNDLGYAEVEGDEETA